MSSRRDFLRSVSLGLAGASIAYPRLNWASDSASQSVPGKEGMILRSFRFLDLEAPPEFLNNWITSVPHFFVRNHMFEPTTLDAHEWRLNISGAVDKPITLSLADLGKFESHSVINTLECAGNGRAFHDPHVPGIQWQKGAVGNARFGGPRLRDLLQRAGVKSSGKHVMFRGLDEVPGKVPPFIRSIPIGQAMPTLSKWKSRPIRVRAGVRLSWAKSKRAMPGACGVTHGRPLGRASTQSCLVLPTARAGCNPKPPCGTRAATFITQSIR